MNDRPSRIVVRQGPTYRRLLELYKEKRFEEADQMVDEVLLMHPRTDAAATSLFTRGQERRWRGDDRGAIRDFELAADSSTNEHARTAAFKAGLLYQLLDDNESATRAFIKAATRWPGTMLAAAAAREVADMELDRPDHWRQVQLDTLDALVANPVAGTNDDLLALVELVDHYWDRPAPADRDPVRAAGSARELLRRSTARGQKHYARQADLALTAIETGRKTGTVEFLLDEGLDPRKPARSLD